MADESGKSRARRFSGWMVRTSAAKLLGMAVSALVGGLSVSSIIAGILRVSDWLIIVGAGGAAATATALIAFRVLQPPLSRQLEGAALSGLPPGPQQGLLLTGQDAITWLDPDVRFRKERSVLNFYCKLGCADARQVETVRRLVPMLIVEFAGKHIATLTFGEFVPKENPDRLLYGGETIGDPKNSGVPLDGSIDVHFIIPAAASTALSAAGLSHRSAFAATLPVIATK